MGDMPEPSNPRRTWTIALVGVVALALVAGGLLVLRQRRDQAADDAAAAAARTLATALATGRLDQVAFAGANPADRQQAYAAATKGLGQPQNTQVDVVSVRRNGDTATARLKVTRQLRAGARWSYDLPVRLVRTATWQVAQGQRLVHPDVAQGETLRLRRAASPRAAVLGAGGQPIVSPRPVVDVGITPSRIKGPAGTLASTVAGIVGVDAAGLAKRVQAASPNAFVDVITLRRNDYEALRSKLQPLPGVVLRPREQPLAPTREFARALLGSLGPVTAEAVTKSKGRLAPGDIAGVSGLQRQYDEQLGGTPGLSVQVLPAGGSGATRTLFTQAGRPGIPLRLTLDTRVQLAADAALQGQTQPSALVAVDVRTGAVLAVANSPATGLNRAMLGRYPPGSTFKIVTTLALLQKGLRPTDSVACPPTAVVEGRSFKNYENEKFGSVPFRTDFAQSCNTAFVGLSKRLGDNDLRATAAQLGIGTPYKLGTDAFSGSVPVTTSAVDKAAASFGQARDEVSPLALAVATASVARGSYIPPTLVITDGAGAASADRAGEPLPAGPIATLRSLMRSVVTDGTGKALASVPGGPVQAKTGTAEFGNATPTRTRAWITGWQGNIAFTAFVEEGKSGGTVAGPVAAKFLQLLAAR